MLDRPLVRRAAMTLAVIALGVPAGRAAAAPTDVSLRIEGQSGTLYEGPLRTTGGPVDGSDGTGAHDCNAGASPAAALAASGISWNGTWNPDFRDFFLDRVGADASQPEATAYWSVLVDRRYVSGLCRAPVAPGSQVLLAYGPGARVLSLAGPARVAVGETFRVAVRDSWIRASTGADGGPVAGASVGGAITGADGVATLRFDTSGLRRLKASAPNAIRSNALDVCVGDARCEGALPTPPATVQAAPLRVTVPARGERYARGGSTLVLRGTAPAPTAVRLEGRSGRRCTGLTGAGRMIARPCGRTADAVPAALAGGGWSKRLREQLAPGRYRLAVSAQGKTTTRTFTVAAGPASAATAARLATRWLRAAQQRGGGFGGTPSARPTPLFTDWAAIALLRSQRCRTACGLRALLARVRAEPVRDLASMERAALALAPSRAKPDRARVRRLQAAIVRRQRADGSWNRDPSATAYALLALRGGGHDRAVRAGRRWLAGRTAITDADTIGAVLWALGPRGRNRGRLAALRAVQGADGGYAVAPGRESNAQSTALAVVGLAASGVNPRSVRSDTGISGVDYLRARQRGSGSLAYARGESRTPVWVTSQALLALHAASR